MVITKTSSKILEISSQPSRAFNIITDFPYINIIHITMVMILLFLIMLASTFQFLSSTIIISRTILTLPLSNNLYPYFPLILLHFSLILGTLDATELPFTNLAL